jgi:hypothetical protein
MQIRGKFLTRAWLSAQEKWQNSEWQDFDGWLKLGSPAIPVFS